MAEDMPLRLPPGCLWYVHGDYVLDVLSGSRRTEQVQVATTLQPMHPDETRRALAVPPPLSIAVQPAPHPLIYSIDALVVLPDGRVWDLLRGEPADTDWPCTVEPFIADLLAPDLFRLRYVLEGYPELQIDPLLRAKVYADTNYLIANAERFPGLVLTDLEHTPFSPWRMAGPTTNND